MPISLSDNAFIRDLISLGARFSFRTAIGRFFLGKRPCIRGWVDFSIRYFFGSPPSKWASITRKTHVLGRDTIPKLNPIIDLNKDPILHCTMYKIVSYGLLIGMIDSLSS